MTDLLLGEREQAAVRAVIASDPVPDAALLGEGALRHLARLIDCDALGIAVTDGNGTTVDPLAGVAATDGLALPTTPARVGVRQRDRMPRGDGPSGGRGVAVLSLGVRSGPDHVVTLWMVRRSSDFTARDRALFALISPALERLLRAHRTSTLPRPSPSRNAECCTTWRPGCPTPRSPHGSSWNRARSASTWRTPTASSASRTASPP